MDVASLSIRVDSNGVPKADRELKKLGQQAGKAETVTGKLGTTSVKASDSLKRLGTSATTVTGSARAMTGGITAAVTAMGAYTVTMASALATGREYEQQQLRTEAQLRATGYAAGFTATQLEAQARALALGTLASTQGVRDAQASLLTFRSISGDTFTRTIELAQDMAAVFGGDLKSATMQLGKALEDPANGLTALRRSGVSFTEEERKMINSMYDTGDAAKAQAFILSKLEAQVGGAGAAESGGLSGSIDTLGQRWDEFTNELYRSTGAGTKMGGVFDSLSGSLSTYTGRLEVARILNEALNDEFDKAINQAGSGKQPYEVAIDEALARYEYAQEQIKKLEGSEPLLFKGAHAQNLQDYRDAAAQALTQIENIRQKYEVQAAIDQQEAADKQKAIQKKLDEDLKRIKEQRAAERLLRDKEIAEVALRQQQARNDQWLLNLEQRMMSETDLINSRADQERIRAETEIHDKEQLAQALVLIEQNKNQQLDQLRQEQNDKFMRDLAQQEAMQRRSLNTVTSFAERQLSLTSNMLQQAGEEQSGLYKALFAAQKAAAIPSMIIATEEAAVKALAAVPPPYNAALSATTRALGYAGVGVVAGQALAGARASGGQTLEGQAYRVGEHGIEMFTGASGEQIFIPPENGTITPTHRINEVLENRSESRLMSEVATVSNAYSASVTDLIRQQTTDTTTNIRTTGITELMLKEVSDSVSNSYNSSVTDVLRRQTVETLTGSRASGGQSLEGSLYRVGEHGIEMFTGRSGQQVFIPPENGSITPTHKMNKSQGDDKGITVNVYGAPEGTTVDYDQQSQTVNIAVGESVKASRRDSVNDLRRGGELSKTLERTYGLRRQGAR